MQSSVTKALFAAAAIMFSSSCFSGETNVEGNIGEVVVDEAEWDKLSEDERKAIETSVKQAFSGQGTQFKIVPEATGEPQIFSRLSNSRAACKVLCDVATWGGSFACLIAVGSSAGPAAAGCPVVAEGVKSLCYADCVRKHKK